MPKNLDKSLTYLVSAAKLGDTNSMERLLSLYSTGFPGVTDERQKFMGMETLADRGCPEAQIELSKWLVSKNSSEAFIEAKNFLMPLADKGNQAAASLLKEMETKINLARAETQRTQALQLEAKQKQSIAKEASQRRSDALGIAIIITAIALLVVTILGVMWGLKDKAVIYHGKSDLVMSCVIAGIFLIAVILILIGHEGVSIGITMCVLGSLILLFSVRTSYLANQKSIGKIIVVVPTKLTLSIMLVFLGMAVYGGLKSGIESSAKASQIDGRSAEGRIEKKKYTKDAARNYQAAGFAAAIGYLAYKLIQKLVKEKSATQ